MSIASTTAAASSLSSKAAALVTAPKSFKKFESAWQSTGFYQYAGAGTAIAGDISEIVFNYLGVRELQIYEGLHETDFNALCTDAANENSAFPKQKSFLANAIAQCSDAGDAYALVERVVQVQFQHLLPLIGGSAQAYFDLPITENWADFAHGSHSIARGVNRFSERYATDVYPPCLWIGLKKDAGSWLSLSSKGVFITAFRSEGSNPETYTLLANTHTHGILNYTAAINSKIGVQATVLEQWNTLIQGTVLAPSKTAATATATSSTVGLAGRTSRSGPIQPSFMETFLSNLDKNTANKKVTPAASTATAAQGTAPPKDPTAPAGK